jgi:hypothetical protein
MSGAAASRLRTPEGRLVVSLPEEFPAGALVLGDLHKPARRNPQRLGDPADRDHRRVPHPALDPADVGPVELGLEPQILLAQALALALGTHGLPEVQQEPGVGG